MEIRFRKDVFDYLFHRTQPKKNKPEAPDIHSLINEILREYQLLKEKFNLKIKMVKTDYE